MPAGFVVHENIERVTVKRLSRKAIRDGWDGLLRLIASTRMGKIGAHLALRFLGSAAQGDLATSRRTILADCCAAFSCAATSPSKTFRREIHTLLARGESVHQLQRVVYTGKLPTERGRRRDEMKAISGSHALLTNALSHGTPPA